ncbi:alpha/beta hydrolase [Novosphingobium sp. 9]|uniref:alpha/beta hydrolase n=1 Tax=Novosphingobium sp. 9 TaxID=2025349 RepID=UPI0021B5BEB2|nr:lysophospholipase [Novosphingobium sp. 9]
MSLSRIVAVALGAGLFSLSGAAAAHVPPKVGSPAQRVIDLPLGGGMQRVLYVAPSHPRATLVMLPGGTGEIGIERDGQLRHGDNFVVRTRLAWVARGYAVLIPDSIDHANMRGARSAAAYGRLVDDLARYARRQVNAPVFLLGTSQGTIAATNAASRAEPGLLSGLVLTESVAVPGRRSTETVFDADPGKVRVPVLVVANRDDACDVAPPALAPQIAAAMVHAPSVRVLTVRGGAQRSPQACGSLSPHGYYGVEAQVISKIAVWMHQHGG